MYARARRGGRARAHVVGVAIVVIVVVVVVGVAIGAGIREGESPSGAGGERRGPASRCEYSAWLIKTAGQVVQTKQMSTEGVQRNSCAFSCFT